MPARGHQIVGTTAGYARPCRLLLLLWSLGLWAWWVQASVELVKTYNTQWGGGVGGGCPPNSGRQQQEHPLGPVD